MGWPIRENMSSGLALSVSRGPNISILAAQSMNFVDGHWGPNPVNTFCPESN